jgi:hypothetical protein
MNAHTLNLRIDRIAVDGLSPAAQKGFPTALEKLLGRMEASDLASAGGRRLSNLDAGRISRTATAEQAASRVVAILRQSLAARGEGAGRV